MTPRRDGDMCACGHVRSGHFYGRRTRLWMSCLRFRGRELCGCRRFTPAPVVGPTPGYVAQRQQRDEQALLCSPPEHAVLPLTFDMARGGERYA